MTDGQLSMFDDLPEPTPEPTLGLHRRADHSTSVEAAESVAGKITKIQQIVLDALADGPLTDEQLEIIGEADGYGPSTVRKRRTELVELGKVKEAGISKNSRGRSVKVWGLV